MRHVVRMVWVAGALGLLASGCGKPPGGSGTTSQPSGISYDPHKDPLVNPKSLFEPAPPDHSTIDTEATLTLQLAGSPNTLNPLFFSSAVEATVEEAIYAGLFTFDKDMKWRVDEDLTESFEELPDHITRIVKMKPGLRWQDGQALTAHDVVFSWQQILDPEVPSLSHKPGTSQIQECVALDDRTVKFVHKEAVATAKWDLSFPIIPRHIFEKEKQQHPDLKSGTYYNEQARRPIGNGRYRFVEWRENDRIVLERWDDYPGRKPFFKRLVFRIIPDRNVTLLSFTKGGLDVVEQLTPLQFANETSDATFASVGYKAWGEQWSYRYIGYNMDGSNPFFQDKRVRYAMTHALNIPLILEKITYGLSPQSLGIYHPNSWMFNPEVQPLPYDLKRAAELLDEAGWKVNSTDGWRYREVDGRRLAFEFTLLLPQGSSDSAKIAAIWQEDLRRLGVRIQTRELEWASFIEKVRKHDFQAEMAGWGTGTDPDLSWNLWRTEEYKSGRNYGGYSNARVDQLFEEGRKEFDFEKRRKVYQEIHKLIYDDQPYTWINVAPTLAAVSQRIHGVEFSPRGIYGFDPGYTAWWTPRGGNKAPAQTP